MDEEDFSREDFAGQPGAKAGAEAEALRTMLRAVGNTAPDQGLDLGTAGLALAALDAPETSLFPYYAHLEELNKAVAVNCADPDDLTARATALATTLGQQFGYQGDWENYEDMRNADLIQVIERRKGLPVALALLYIAAARAQGWQCEGINFPAHFLIRLGHGAARCILDPFNGGKILAPNDLRELLKYFGGGTAELKPEFYEPVSDHALLLRLLNNIKARAVAAQDLARTDEILTRMLMIAPKEAMMWHEQGMIRARRGNIGGAIESMGQCRTHAQDPKLRKFAEVALEKLRQHLN